MRLKYILSLLSVTLLLTFPLTIRGQDDEDEEVEDVELDVEEEKEPVVVRERPVYSRPLPSGPTYFVEPFDTRAEYLKRWIPSQAKKEGVEEDVAKYDGLWDVEEPRDSLIANDLGLILKSKARHHAISAKLDRPFEFKGTSLMIQYEVNFQNGIDCGGAYIKLLSASDKINLKTFTDKTPYTIMFGPDKCGNDHKLHFIFRHKNLKTGVFEEKHAEKPTAKLDKFFSDRKTHLYTLIVNPDNSYEVKVDNGLVASGNLLENVSPPVNPPKEIEDPNDKKPEDWDSREKISDPDAVKPDDWDESEPATIPDEDAVMPDGWLEDKEAYIPDPTATKPEDWDDEMDGEWEAPRIENLECADAAGCGPWERPTKANPNYKGIWKAPMIDNPDYKGQWKPQMIPNPDYFEDLTPYKMTPIIAVGLELWSMSDNILFDNFIIADNSSVLDDYTADTWEIKSNEERAASSTGQSIVQAVKDMTNERPWLWAAFILVVVLPVVLIITYCCCSSGPTKGWWQAIKSSTEGRQWLWGVYVMVILLPIVLLSICLCPKSGPLKPEDIDAHRKKFDDSSPDVKEDEEGEKEDEVTQEEGEEKGAGGDGEPLDEDKEEKNEDEAGEASQESGDQNQEDEEQEAEGSPKKPNSPRRRKARKE